VGHRCWGRGDLGAAHGLDRPGHPGMDGLLWPVPPIRTAPAARQDQLPRPGMDPGQIPAAQAPQGHEARLEPDHRPDAGAAAPLALGNRGLVLTSQMARARRAR